MTNTMNNEKRELKEITVPNLKTNTRNGALIFSIDAGYKFINAQQNYVIYGSLKYNTGRNAFKITFIYSTNYEYPLLKKMFKDGKCIETTLDKKKQDNFKIIIRKMIMNYKNSPSANPNDVALIFQNEYSVTNNAQKDVPVIEDNTTQSVADTQESVADTNSVANTNNDNSYPVLEDYNEITNTQKTVADTQKTVVNTQESVVNTQNINNNTTNDMANKIKQAAKENQSLKNQLAESNKDNKSLKAENESLKAEIAKLKATIAKMSQNTKDNKAIVNEYPIVNDKLIEDFNKKLEKTQKKFFDLSNALESVQNQYDQVKKELDSTKTDIINMNEAHKKEMASLANIVDQLQKNMESLIKKNDSLESKLTSLDKNNKTLVKSNSDLAKANVSMEKKIKALESSNDLLEKEVKSLKEVNTSIEKNHASDIAELKNLIASELKSLNARIDNITVVNTPVDESVITETSVTNTTDNHITNTTETSVADTTPIKKETKPVLTAQELIESKSLDEMEYQELQRIGKFFKIGAANNSPRVKLIAILQDIIAQEENDDSKLNSNEEDFELPDLEDFDLFEDETSNSETQEVITDCDDECEDDFFDDEDDDYCDDFDNSISVCTTKIDTSIF